MSRSTLLEVAPFVVTGGGGLRVPAGAEGDLNQTTREVGLDLKYGLTTNLTADVSVNMDFAQVESDALEINLGRFNLFFPEKRGFFQERSSVFDFQMSDEARLFHSRRIGLTDTGQPQRILAAGRVTGRVGDMDLGLMNLQVDGLDSQPSENVTVARVAATTNTGSSWGAMLTTRLPTDAAARVDVGVDGSWALGDGRFLTVQGAYTGEQDTSDGIADRSLVRVFAEKRSGNGWGGFFDASRAGPRFAPALGFMERDDYLAVKTHVRHTWQRDSDSPFSWFRGISTARLYLRNADRSVETGLFRLRWSGVFKGGTFLNAALNFNYEDLAEPLTLPGSTVPASNYFGPSLFVNVWLPERRNVMTEGIIEVGTFLDGWQTRLNLIPTWRPTPALSVSPELRLNRLWFGVRDETVDAHVFRLRMGLAPNTSLSMESFLQYETAGERVSADGRIRYRFSEGRDLYLVLTGAAYPDARFEGLASTRSRQHRVLFKYVHTFRP